MTKAPEQIWASCCEFIKSNITPQKFDTWFRDVTCMQYDAERNAVALRVPGEFFADNIDNNYGALVRMAFAKELGHKVDIYYCYPTVRGDESSDISQRSVEMSPEILRQRQAPPAVPSQNRSNTDFDPQLNPRYTFENYCCGESNKLARAIGESIGNNPSQQTFNPLFVFGPAGVGKTHLVQAIGIRIKERNPRARVLYITARLFINQYTANRQNLNSFFHFYQSIDTLIIDDVQDLQGMAATQNTFFHIFNHLHQHNKQIIMSSDRAPAEMEGFEERLLSRFKWGAQVELERPDLPLRRAVLQLKSEQDGVSLPPEVAEYIAGSVTSSVRELEGVMVSLLAHATVLNREISLDLARRVLANAVKINRRQVNFEMITDAVASHYGIKPDLLFTKTRRREVSDPRQVVMYLSKKLANMPSTTIGHKLDRTHATVIHAISNIESRMTTEKKLVADLDAIEAALSSHP